MVRDTALVELALRLHPKRARALVGDDALERELDDAGGRAVFVLLATGFPPLLSRTTADLEICRGIAAEGWSAPRDRDTLRAALDARARGLVGDAFFLALRRFARFERARVALRELLPRAFGGADVDVSSAELSALADVVVDAALAEATTWAESRYGEPRTRAGTRSTFTVLGMGKLGGDELNAGSDIDLVYFYDADDGEAVSAAGESTSLHEFWSRVARRLTRAIEEPTDEGFVFRVDLRLRPEGARGPIVNSEHAAERYYESFGRFWERAALLRARPIAGDLALGHRLLATLEPFVWRRRIDPTIARDMHALVLQSRAELSRDGARDLKLAVGGIREAEFFVQTLQLVWGGKHPALRARNTMQAVALLEARGYITPREAADVADAYLALRRAEHMVQSMSGVQTHSLPEGPELETLAVSMGFGSISAFQSDLAGHMRRVAARFQSLLADLDPLAPSPTRALGAAIEREDVQAITLALVELAQEPEPLAQRLLDLAKVPDGILGSRTREAHADLVEGVLEAILEAADPAQAAFYLHIFFKRVKQPAVYVRLMSADPTALRRIVAVLGASAFVGDALVNNPELGDMILFSREAVTPEAARREVLAAREHRASVEEDPDETLIGALRLAKTRVTIETALGVLAGGLGVRQVSEVLSAVADASLEIALRRALSSSGGGDDDVEPVGFVVIAMGKLGGEEISFGSDLDLFFLYDPSSVPDTVDAPAYFTKRARRVITLISAFHGAGPGYELDVRLRPSGNQGLLVTSMEAFARYHGVNESDLDGPKSSTRAAVWERMALTRARPAAGDLALGERAVRLIRAAAQATGCEPDSGEEIVRIRQRVERESSRERRGVHDLKLGRGGLLDIEFVVQLSMIRAAGDLGAAGAPWVRDTSLAIVALEALDLLTEAQAETLGSAYRFLRRLELMVRVARADASHILELDSPSLRPLARRMGVRDRPLKGAPDVLVAQYRATADAVRAVFEEVVGRPSVNPTTGRSPDC